MKILKKNIFCVLSLLILLVVGGCEDNIRDSGAYAPSLVPRYLAVSGERIYYPAEGGTYQLYVESEDSPWKFEENPGWVTLSPISGSKSSDVEVSVDVNPYASDRSSFFYLRSNTTDWNFERTMLVSQDKSSPYVSVEQTSYSFSGAQGSQTVAINSNCDWEATSSQSWLTLQVTQNGEGLILNVEENPSSNYRNATVSIKYESQIYVTLTIEQFPAEISVSDEVLTFDNTASKYDMTITSESSWGSVVSADWIQLSPSQGGAGVTEVSIEVTPNESVNERTGYVAISTGSSERLQIEIIQKGLYLESEELVSLSARAESKTVMISSNLDWEVTDQPNWLEVSPLSGFGKKEITLTPTVNESLQPRSGLLILNSQGLDISCTINVIQEGKSLTPGSTLLQFDDKGGTQEFEIIADGDWTSTVSANWISASPLSGKGDATIKVTVEENMTDSDRTGTITYKFGEKLTEVTITQQSKYFDIDNNEFTFDSAGGSHIIDFSGNQKWSAELEGKPGWISMEPSTGEGESQIKIVAAPNKTLNDRTATLIIKPEYSQVIRISILQKGMYLKVSTSGLLFFAKGGESAIVEVDTDGEYSVSADVAWLSINQVSEKSFKVVAQENTSSDSRKGNVNLVLKGLSEGSYTLTIPVEQAPLGGTFIIEGFPTDGNWNNASKGSLSITVNGYTNDQNWNSDAKSSLTITVTEYSADKDWNNAQ